MNYGIVLRVVGIILIIESILMIPSYIIALYSNQGDEMAFLATILLTLLIGLLFQGRGKLVKKLNPQEGFAIVTFAWISVSIFGALPLYISSSTETFIDAFFEIVSGFTTTGATILTNVESLPNAVMFWRSFTHWIGGMGILVFTLALLPMLGISGFQMFKAESPGPIAGKIVPRLKDTAKILYITYITITILQVILLALGGMNLYDAILYTFATVGTGGFAITQNGISAYNSTYIYVVVGIFMMISGINFSLYYVGFKGRIRDIFKDEEFILYLSIIGGATILISLNLISNSYTSIGIAIRDAFFHVSSMITTTGYSIAEGEMWPSFSKGILLILMLVGGSAGSTAGGIKIIRLLVVFKLIKREVGKLFHPRAVIPIKINGKVMANEKVAGIYSFLSLYVVIFVISTLLITLDGIDLQTAATAVISTISNIGIEFTGIARSFAEFSQPVKLLLSFLMILGRLELFTVIALMSPRVWRRRT